MTKDEEPADDPYQRIADWMAEYDTITNDLLSIGVSSDVALMLCRALASVNMIVVARRDLYTLVADFTGAPITTTA
jgi:predicted NBD/HSP70 family sugar kinase